MATLVLAAAGSAIGGSIGGGILGVSAAAIGQAAGATLGRAIDQKVFGLGSRTVSSGQIDSFRLNSASNGIPIPRVFGKMRIAGQMIWSSNFLETVTTSSQSGGKGAGPTVTTNAYSYSINVAFAVGEGVVSKIGRIWADGQEISPADLNMTLYHGDNDQFPDPVISSTEGIENTPAFRGTAYVVIEGFQLADFGNRVPQMNFEVFRKAQSDKPEHISDKIKGVCLIPGTGEFAMSTTHVRYDYGQGNSNSANKNTGRGVTDFEAGLSDLDTDIPNCHSVSLVVSWFGDDLRCGSCDLKPKVEQAVANTEPYDWMVSGISRASADVVSKIDDRPVFGGTPSDRSVIEAISHVQGTGKDIVFYPFILMDIQADNTLGNPWSEIGDQPIMPWRGRITTSKAPGVIGSPDQTVAAGLEVAEFFGAAQASDFSIHDGSVVYSGPSEWSYRRFILHNAMLCQAAGGVKAFCIGSEMTGLTRVQDAVGSFATVLQLKQLAGEVRTILGASTLIGYAADWSEYFGYHAKDGSNSVWYNLDELWSDPEIDFVGIDNYMPLSDWRDGTSHLDAEFGSIYDKEYLKSNVQGGEGYDWYYANDADRSNQVRSPITDGAYSEDWVFRYKDIKNWWSQAHHNRPLGLKDTVATSWVPESKPIWFTEFGCPAVDRGTNQPNVFIDPKSSESSAPYSSRGSEDSFIQYQYLDAVLEYWSDDANNPASSIYSGKMIEIDRAHVWAWDSRPWPDFPARSNVWSDGQNYHTGHWLTGRITSQSLNLIVAELCELSGLTDYDVSKLYGLVSGFAVTKVDTTRSALQNLMMAYDFACFEREGVLTFESNIQGAPYPFKSELLVANPETGSGLEQTRASKAEISGRVRLKFLDESKDYQLGYSEAQFPEDEDVTVSEYTVPVVMAQNFAKAIAERWLVNGRIARDEVQFALPPSMQTVEVGDKFSIDGSAQIFRVTEIEEAGSRIISAHRVENNEIIVSSRNEILHVPFRSASELPVYPVFLDLPMLPNASNSAAPFIAINAEPWPGSVSVHSSDQQSGGFELNTVVTSSSIFGTLGTEFVRSDPGRFSTGLSLDVSISSGDLQSKNEIEVLNGQNAAAIWNESVEAWEVFQFSNANLIAPKLYRLSGFLRGQLGTEFAVSDVHPIGAEIVFLDENMSRIALQDNEFGLERFFQVGPSKSSLSSESMRSSTQTFSGVVNRPYSPVHFSQDLNDLGEDVYSWTRRSRVLGDSWQGYDVPLGEDAELYLVSIWAGSQLLRQVETDSNNWTYPTGLKIIDELQGTLEIAISQVSDTFGPGPEIRMEINV